MALDWDDVDGADSYRVRWQQASPERRLNESISVDAAKRALASAEYGELREMRAKSTRTSIIIAEGL